jgi:hypothetical protein
MLAIFNLPGLVKIPNISVHFGLILNFLEKTLPTVSGESRSDLRLVVSVIVFESLTFKVMKTLEIVITLMLRRLKNGQHGT